MALLSKANFYGIELESAYYKIEKAFHYDSNQIHIRLKTYKSKEFRDSNPDEFISKNINIPVELDRVVNVYAEIYNWLKTNYFEGAATDI